jgi:L-ascorbate metabolism protein UlaG (beta-lactamase superfamily)
MHFLTDRYHPKAALLLIPFLLLVPFWSNPQTQKSKDEITISYKGNMGIHISNSRISVLIDGLHEYYGPEYLYPPASEINKMINRQDAYNNLTLALFTHYHKDHYSAKLVRAFLQSSLQNRVVGSTQVADSLTTQQTIIAWNKNQKIFTDTSSDLSIYAFNIPHTWPERHSKVQNIAYIIKTGGSSILHIGDAAADASAFNAVKKEKIDVMIVPIWFLMDDEGIKIIREIIKPAKVIATHISPNEKKGWDRYKLPGTDTHFFTRLNQLVQL